MLNIRGLVRRFGPVTALAGIDLDVAQGEVFALLGGSGSGKTTLLRCIAGFETPDAGRITLDGTDLLGLPPYRRKLNTMFQSYALFPHMNVAANIAFGVRELDRAARARRVSEMLDLVRLPGLGDRRPHQLSGGQRQRVALARALARQPALLLLDEPLSALDQALREGTRQELLALQKQLGTTFVLVTHDQEEALGMASRIGIMRAGRLVQVGAPAALYERPATRFVAEFLGAANVLDTIVADAGVLALGGIRIRTEDATPASGTAVAIAVRPERIRLQAGENTLRGRVRDIAYRGESYVLTVQTEGDVELRVVARADEGPFAPCTQLTLGWSAAATIVLGRE